VLLVLLASGVRLSREEQQTYLLTYSRSLGMRGIPLLVQYRGIKSGGIIYRGLTKYRGIPSGDTDFQ